MEPGRTRHEAGAQAHTGSHNSDPAGPRFSCAWFPGIWGLILTSKCCGTFPREMNKHLFILDGVLMTNDYPSLPWRVSDFIGVTYNSIGVLTVVAS